MIMFGRGQEKLDGGFFNKIIGKSGFLGAKNRFRGGGGPISEKFIEGGARGDPNFLKGLLAFRKNGRQGGRFLFFHSGGSGQGQMPGGEYGTWSKAAHLGPNGGNPSPMEEEFRRGKRGTWAAQLAGARWRHLQKKPPKGTLGREGDHRREHYFTNA